MRNCLWVLVIVALFASVSANYMHAYDSYYAVFDGEGDAITYAKLTVQNSGPLAMDSLRLTIPGTARVYEVMQVENGAGQWECGNLPYECAGKGGAPYGGGSMELPYQRGNMKRVKYDVDYEENTELGIRLNSYVPVDGETTIIIFYKARGYAQRDFAGVYNFNFRTIVDREAMLTQKASATVSVVPELSLAGVESHVDYQMNEFMKAGAMAPTAEGRAQALYSISERIERFGGVSKTGYNIDPGESFVVAGYFADAWWKLYIVPALALAGFALAAFALARKFGLGIAGWGRHIESAAYGAASAIAAVVLLAVFAFSAGIASQGYNALAPIFALLMLPSGFGAMLSFFGGAALAWRKNGAKHGALALLITLALMVVLIFAAALLLTPQPRVFY